MDGLIITIIGIIISATIYYGSGNGILFWIALIATGTRFWTWNVMYKQFLQIGSLDLVSNRLSQRNMTSFIVIVTVLLVELFW